MHPLLAVGLLVAGVLGAWGLSWYVTDHVVGARKPGRRVPPEQAPPGGRRG